MGSPLFWQRLTAQFQGIIEVPLFLPLYTISEWATHQTQFYAPTGNSFWPTLFQAGGGVPNVGNFRATVLYPTSRSLVGFNQSSNGVFNAVNSPATTYGPWLGTWRWNAGFTQQYSNVTSFYPEIVTTLGPLAFTQGVPRIISGGSVGLGNYNFAMNGLPAFGGFYFVNASADCNLYCRLYGTPNYVIQTAPGGFNFFATAYATSAALPIRVVNPDYSSFGINGHDSNWVMVGAPNPTVGGIPNTFSLCQVYSTLGPSGGVQYQFNVFSGNVIDGRQFFINFDFTPLNAFYVNGNDQSQFVNVCYQGYILPINSNVGISNGQGKTVILLSRDGTKYWSLVFAPQSAAAATLFNGFGNNYSVSIDPQGVVYLISSVTPTNFLTSWGISFPFRIPKSIDISINPGVSLPCIPECF